MFGVVLFRNVSANQLSYVSYTKHIANHSCPKRFLTCAMLLLWISVLAVPKRYFLNSTPEGLEDQLSLSIIWRWF